MSVQVRKQKRLVVWHLVYDISHNTCRKHFPGLPFGRYLEHLFVMGAVLANENESKKATATSIAEYLEMPRENVRRRLRELVAMDLLARDGSSYTRGVKTVSTHVDAMADLVLVAARKLIELERRAQLEQFSTLKSRSA